MAKVIFKYNVSCDYEKEIEVPDAEYKNLIKYKKAVDKIFEDENWKDYYCSNERKNYLESSENIKKFIDLDSIKEEYSNKNVYDIYGVSISSENGEELIEY